MDPMSPIRLLASRLRDAAEPAEARKAAAALAAVAWAAEQAHQLAAQIRAVGRTAPDPGAVRKLADQLAHRAEGVARLVWEGDAALRVSPVDYLAGLLPGPARENAAVVAGALGRLGQAAALTLDIAAELRELGQNGVLAQRAVAEDVADRVAAAADALGATWAEPA